MKLFVLPWSGSAKDAPQPAKHIQVIPLYTKANTATYEYFKNNEDVADSLSGTAITIVLAESIKEGNAEAFFTLFEGEEPKRYPGLKRSDLPCLWIEDSAGHAKVHITNSDDPNEMISILADEAGDASSAKDLAARLQRKHSEMFAQSTAAAFYTATTEKLTMTKTHEKLIAVLFGAAFLIALLVLAIVFPTPTPFQYTVFRIVLAVAAAGFVSMTPGFIEINVSNWIKAGGALGVFVIIYFYSPALLLANP